MLFIPERYRLLQNWSNSFKTSKPTKVLMDSWIQQYESLSTTGEKNLKSAFPDSTVSPGWQQTVAAASSPNSNCCFEVVEPGLNSAVPPEGGFVDLNATCSHDSRTLGTGVLACDMPAGKLAMANRTLFIRSETVAVGSSERSGELLGRSNDGQSTTGHCHLLLKLLFSYCSWTLSQNFRIL